MQKERSDAEARAEGLRVSLAVRKNRAGDPVWYACWRDVGGRSFMRTVGPAWLTPITKDPNGFIRKARDDERAKYVAEKWRMSWEVRGTRAEDDKTEKRRRGAMTDREARKRADELVILRELEREDLLDRVARSKDPRTFADLADRWLDEKRAEVRDGQLKPSSLADYEGVMRRPAPAKGKRRAPRAWVLREFGERKPMEVTTKETERFLKNLRDEHGLSERTRHKHAMVLGMVFAFALDEGWIKANPMANRKRAKRGARRRKTISVYTVEQVEAIARQANDQDGEIIRLAAFSGLRRGELLALRWGHIDWSGEAIRVQASWDHRAGVEGAPKSGEVRTVPLSEQAAQALERQSKRSKKSGATDLVFPGVKAEHLDASALRRRYVKARNTVIAQDPDCPSITFHDCRHTFGSLCAAAGVPLVDIQTYMGHADIATTSVYLHFVPRTDAARRVSQALRGRSVEALAEALA